MPVIPPVRQSHARDLFNRPARLYDPVSRLFSLGSSAWYRRRCLRQAGLWPGFRVVDVACGTGLLVHKVLAPTGDRRAVIGIDVSEAMLAVSQKSLGIPLVLGAAEALPLAGAVADFVTMGYTLRHVADLAATFREARRVLRPKGTLLLREISMPRRWLTRILASGYIGRLGAAAVAADDPGSVRPRAAALSLGDDHELPCRRR